MKPSNPQPSVPAVAPYWPGDDSTPGEAPYKRTGKTKKELLKCYDQRVKASKKWRADNYDDTWRRTIDLYRGKHFTGSSTEDRIMVNVSFSTVNVIVPSVAVNDPNITVNARTPEEEENADTAEIAANYWWRRWHWRDEVKRSVKDSLVVSHGWAKVGWKYEEKLRALSGQEQQQQYAQLVAQADQAAAENPEIAPELPSDDDIYEQVPDAVPEVSEDRPFVERVSPFDIFVDPESTCEQDLKWIAQRLVVPIQRVLKDERYKKSARNKLRPDASTNSRWRDKENQSTSDNGADANDDIQRVTLWEYWDIEHEFYCVYAEGMTDDFLVEPTDFPYAFGHPFVYLPNYEVPDQFYSLSDLEMLEPMQRELNAVRSDMTNHRKRWQRAYMALRDKLSPEAQNVLTSNKDGRIVFVDGDEDLARIIQPIPQVSLDPQMYQYSDQIESDIEIVSGVSEYQRGSAPEIRRTATEANMIQDATNARVADKLAQIEYFMARIANRVVQLAQQYLTGEHVAAIVGPDGQKSWKQFTRDEIAGEFDFTVEAGSTQPKNEAYKRQQALQLLQVMQPFMGAVIDPGAMAAYVLKEAFGIKDPQPFMAQPDPNQKPPLTEKIIESLSYKDVPADIQRQMEEQAGFQPSQIGGASQVELAALQHDQAVHQADLGAQHQQEQKLLDTALADATAPKEPKGGASGGPSAK